MVLEKVKKFLASQFEIDESEISEDTDIVNDLGADSLDVVELLTVLEEEYNIVITDEAVFSMTTVGDISDFIENVLKK